MPDLRTITEAEAERMCDRAVIRRLATDRAYLNADNADEQAERECAITDEEWGRITTAYVVDYS